MFHIAFYRFTPIANPVALVKSLRHLARHLLGSILVAEEGINGVLAGTVNDLDDFERALNQPDFYDGAFTGMQFQRSTCNTPPFARLKISVKDELVALGNDRAPDDSTGATKLLQSHVVDVAPHHWRALMDANDVVLIDNRNSFEYRLGHFKGAIDPEVNNFREFSDFLNSHLPAWKAAGKRLAMYCTGGIRCEKTASNIQDAGMPIYQLQGGILNYFQSMPDAQQEWVGECFVFDNRVALNTQLKETSTTAQQVYTTPADAWRLERAVKLDQAK